MIFTSKLVYWTIYDSYKTVMPRKRARKLYRQWKKHVSWGPVVYKTIK